MLNAADLLSIASVLVGIAGLVFAYIEHRGRVKAEQMLKNELTAILNRVRVLVPYGKSISSMLEGIDNPKLNRWVWVKYKGLSDLYVLIVTHYLAAQKEFRYTDLKRL